MKITAITNPADLHKFVKTFYEQHATALNEMMPKLPEAVRAEMKTLYDSLNESLKLCRRWNKCPPRRKRAGRSTLLPTRWCGCRSMRAACSTS